MSETHTGTFNIQDDTFQTEVLESELPTVVDFWAPWCGPCRMVAPILDALAIEYAGVIRIAKLNTDENQDVASRLGIMGIPTMIFFHKGQEVDRVVGALPHKNLKAKFEDVLERCQNAAA